MKKFSCCDCCYYHLPLADRPSTLGLVASILDVGYDGVDIGMWGPVATLGAVEVARPDELRAVRKVVEELGKEISSIQIGDVHLGRPEFAMNRLTKAAEYAEILDCRGIVACANMEDIKPFEVLDRLTMIVEEVLPILKESNCWLGFENHCNEVFWAHRTTEDMMITARKLEKLGMLDRVGLVPDSSHFLRAFSDPIEAFRQCMPYSKMLHLKDATEHAFVALGKGTVDFDAIFRLVRQASYQEAMSVELEFQIETPDVEAELKKSLEYFRALANTYDIK